MPPRCNDMNLMGISRSLFEENAKTTSKNALRNLPRFLKLLGGALRNGANFPSYYVGASTFFSFPYPLLPSSLAHNPPSSVRPRIESSAAPDPPLVFSFTRNESLPRSPTPVRFKINSCVRRGCGGGGCVE